MVCGRIVESNPPEAGHWYTVRCEQPVVAKYAYILLPGTGRYLAFHEFQAKTKCSEMALPSATLLHLEGALRIGEVGQDHDLVFSVGGAAGLAEAGLVAPRFDVR